MIIFVYLDPYVMFTINKLNLTNFIVTVENVCLSDIHMEKKVGKFITTGFDLLLNNSV